jgi:hypothetical protein
MSSIHLLISISTYTCPYHQLLTYTSHGEHLHSGLQQLQSLHRVPLGSLDQKLIFGVPLHVECSTAFSSDYEDFSANRVSFQALAETLAQSNTALLCSCVNQHSGLVEFFALIASHPPPTETRTEVDASALKSEENIDPNSNPSTGMSLTGSMTDATTSEYEPKPPRGPRGTAAERHLQPSLLLLRLASREQLVVQTSDDQIAESCREHAVSSKTHR